MRRINELTFRRNFNKMEESYSEKNHIIIYGDDVKLHSYSHKAKEGPLQDDWHDSIEEEPRDEIGDRVNQNEEIVMKSNFVKFVSQKIVDKIEGSDIIDIHI